MTNSPEPKPEDVLKVVRSEYERVGGATLSIRQARIAVMRELNLSRYSAWRALLVASGLGYLTVDVASGIIRFMNKEEGVHDE